MVEAKEGMSWPDPCETAVGQRRAAFDDDVDVLHTVEEFTGQRCHRFADETPEARAFQRIYLRRAEALQRVL